MSKKLGRKRMKALPGSARKFGDELVVVRDSKDLDLHEGTRMRVLRADSRWMDVEVPSLEIRYVGLSVHHPDIAEAPQGWPPAPSLKKFHRWRTAKMSKPWLQGTSGRPLGRGGIKTPTTSGHAPIRTKRKIGDALVVVRDSRDLGMEAGTRMRVVWTDGRLMDVDVPRLDTAYAGIAVNHPDIAAIRPQDSESVRPKVPRSRGKRP